MSRTRRRTGSPSSRRSPSASAAHPATPDSRGCRTASPGGAQRPGRRRRDVRPDRRSPPNSIVRGSTRRATAWISVNKGRARQPTRASPPTDAVGRRARPRRCPSRSGPPGWAWLDPAAGRGRDRLLLAPRRSRPARPVRRMDHRRRDLLPRGMARRDRAPGAHDRLPCRVRAPRVGRSCSRPPGSGAGATS